MSIHPVLNVSGHFIRVEIVEVLERKQTILMKRMTLIEGFELQMTITPIDL